MPCIGYAQSAPDEGSLSADANPSPVALLTAFAPRHPLPQGEGKKCAYGFHSIFLTGRPEVGLTSSPAWAKPLRS
jgi:hypothetical protein